jgi:hypothetical protein
MKHEGRQDAVVVVNKVNGVNTVPLHTVGHTQLIPRMERPVEWGAGEEKRKES